MSWTAPNIGARAPNIRTQTPPITKPCVRWPHRDASGSAPSLLMSAKPFSFCVQEFTYPCGNLRSCWEGSPLVFRTITSLPCLRRESSRNVTQVTRTIPIRDTGRRRNKTHRTQPMGHPRRQDRRCRLPVSAKATRPVKPLLQLALLRDNRTLEVPCHGYRYYD